MCWYVVVELPCAVPRRSTRGHDMTEVMSCSHVPRLTNSRQSMQRRAPGPPQPRAVPAPTRHPQACGMRAGAHMLNAGALGCASLLASCCASELKLGSRIFWHPCWHPGVGLYYTVELDRRTRVTTGINQGSTRTLERKKPPLFFGCINGLYGLNGDGRTAFGVYVHYNYDVRVQQRPGLPGESHAT